MDTKYKKIHGNHTAKIPDILKIATDYYRDLYTTRKVDLEDLKFKAYTPVEK